MHYYPDSRDILHLLALAFWYLPISSFWKCSLRLAIWILLRALFSAERLRIVSIMIICILLVVTARAMDWGRTKWSERYFNVQLPKLADPNKTLTLVAGMAPLGYLVREFPASVRFVRIQSNFQHTPGVPQALVARIRHIIAEHRGPLYALFQLDEEARARKAFDDFDLAIIDHDCRVIVTGEDVNGSWVTKFCGLEKRAN